MKKTILFGGSGFLGHIFLKEYSDIISVGRNHPTQSGSEIKNTHIHIPDMDSLHLLDDVEFENVIFLVGNSNHHKINSNCMMGMDYNVIPLKKILHYLKDRKIGSTISSAFDKHLGPYVLLERSLNYRQNRHLGSYSKQVYHHT